MEQAVTIHHWRHEDGWHNIPAFLLKDPKAPNREFHEGIVGWHCWVYCKDHYEFVQWMKEHCPTAECTARFNSGDPMVTVHITDKDEAAYFVLNFDI
jgi:hypothetical protein